MTEDMRAYQELCQWLESDREADALHRQRTDDMARSYGATADEMPVCASS